MADLLRVEGINKRFRGLHAIKDLSFSVGRGEILGIIGPNGAGKTTAFNLITGFQRPDSGHIFLDGREITGRPPYDLCRLGIARTFQVARPFGRMTVLENVMSGALLRTAEVGAARERAGEVIERVGLDAFREVPAQRLNTINQRRLELARAVATRPGLLLLDESMAGLTHQEVEVVLRLIRELRQGGLTLVVVEHNVRALMSVADRLLVLVYGEKLTAGSPAEVRQDRRVIEAYLGTQEEAAEAELGAE